MSDKLSVNQAAQTTNAGSVTGGNNAEPPKPPKLPEMFPGDKKPGDTDFGTFGLQLEHTPGEAPRVKVTNEQNTAGAYSGTVEVGQNEQGATNLTVKSDKSGQEYHYTDVAGTFFQTDENGQYVFDKDGNLKGYKLENGEMKRVNNMDTNVNTEIAEATVTTSKKPENLNMTAEVQGLPVEISDGTSRMMAINDIESKGGKIIKRKVDGEYREIAVYRDENGKKVRQLINDDGSMTNLIAETTFGKNTYRTDTPPVYYAEQNKEE
mgnify:CR=1 FL=1